MIVAADDRAYPILAYSDGDVFDENTIPDGMRYYLEHYGREIQYAIDNELVAEDEVVEQWDLLRKEGVIMQTRMEKAVSPLLTTVWNQDWPYNYYAPACQSYWTNDHCYAGCVATAMSQVMKYWNWPETGVGEHSYNTSSYPGNGQALSANFGETTYEWAIMPNSVSSPNAGGLAVALLMYHCGISVDMDYAPNGSGSFTERVAPALIEYFRYGANAHIEYRESYTRTEWEDMLIESFDNGLPVLYSGSGTQGGHAFNCDGYNNQRMFHFNWGWGGMYNNTYYQIDALNPGSDTYNDYQKVVFDIMPDYIYNAMVPAIESFDVNVDGTITKTVNLSWTVPTVSESGLPLESIQRIVVKRNGTTIQTYDNPQPGETVTLEDNVVDYGAYRYTIYGVNNELTGEMISKSVVVGPSCTWKVVCQTTNYQGWGDGKLQVMGSGNVILTEIQLTNSSPVSEKIRFPEGTVALKWVEPLSPISSMTITLKNSANESVYSFNGSSTQLSGTIYTGNNDCPSCTAPTDFAGEYAYQNNVDGALLTWNCAYTPSKFKIYRSADGQEYTPIATIDGSLNEYFDAVGVANEYYYRVTAFSSACESDPAHTASNTDYVVVEVLAVPENSVNARVYPNPTTGNVKIEAPALNNVTVFNLVGQKVYEEAVSGDECVVNMKDFGCGIYMVKIQSANGFTTQKVSVIE